MNYTFYTHSKCVFKLTTHTHTLGVAGNLFNSAYMQPICKSCLCLCLKWEPEQRHKKKTNDPLNAKLVHFHRVSRGVGGQKG